MRLLIRLLVVIVVLFAGAWVAAWAALRDGPHEYAAVTDAQRDEARAYLASALDPMPDGWRWDSFEPAPGVTLRTGIIRANDAKGTVIVVPGYSAPVEMFALSIARFHAADYTVAALDYRGQGKSWRPLPNPEKGHVEDYGVLAADLKAFAEDRREAGKPLFFYSTSQGAHITLRMAGDLGEIGDGYALIVPMIRILTGEYGYGTARRLAGGLTAAGMGTYFAPGRGQWTADGLVFGEETDCNANPRKAQIRDALFALDEALRVDGTTARWVDVTIASSDLLMTDAYRARITKPVVMFNAGDDRIVDAPAASALCAGLPDCTERVYDGARHCMAQEWDENRDDVIARSIAFFDANL